MMGHAIETGGQQSTGGLWLSLSSLSALINLIHITIHSSHPTLSKKKKSSPPI
jgi:hypothetical protein